VRIIVGRGRVARIVIGVGIKRLKGIPGREELGTAAKASSSAVLRCEA
jgi:hypothetical protein